MEINKNKLKVLCERVYKELGGYGLHETTYEKALAAEIQDLGYNVQTEYNVPLNYTTTLGRTIQLTTLRMDILINNTTILELKTIEKNFNKNLNMLKEYKQIIRYGKITGIKKLYLINFGKDKIDFIEIS